MAWRRWRVYTMHNAQTDAIKLQYPKFSCDDDDDAATGGGGGGGGGGSANDAYYS